MLALKRLWSSPRVPVPLSFLRHTLATSTTPKMTSSHLVWIDMEMTGLDHNTDKILEVACIVTDKVINIDMTLYNYRSIPVTKFFCSRT